MALALIAAFIAIELRSQSPLVSFGIFRNRTLTGANVVGLLVAMALFSMFFFVSLYMQQVLGYDALKAGLAYLPLAVGIIVLGRRRVAARDPRRLQADADRRAPPHRRRADLVRARSRRTASTSPTSCPRRCSPRSASASRSSP